MSCNPYNTNCGYSYGCNPTNYCMPTTSYSTPTSFCNPYQQPCKQTNFTGTPTIQVTDSGASPTTYCVNINGSGMSTVVVGAGPTSVATGRACVAGVTSCNTNCFTATIELTPSSPSSASECPAYCGVLKLTCCGGNVFGSLNSNTFTTPAATSTTPGSVSVTGTCCLACGVRTITLTSIVINVTSVSL